MIRRYVAPVCCVLNVNNKKIVKTACTLRLGLHYCDAGTVQFQYRFPPRIYLIVCTHCPMRSMAGVNKKMMTPPDQIAVPTVKWCRNRFSWVWTPMRSYSIVDKKKRVLHNFGPFAMQIQLYNLCDWIRLTQTLHIICTAMRLKITCYVWHRYSVNPTLK